MANSFESSPADGDLADSGSLAPGLKELATGLAPATREELAGLPVEVAPRLLGGMLQVTVAGATVAVRLTEVEA